ncbi:MULTISPECIES: hypothetical protein [unclassified Arcicella]|uniref:hypothetical protein n=1 Tax=unclassified Arcicella TaxID=2644986 RepID=UPI00285D68BB|nr:MULTISPECIES: hypothetical protein [unclassified Arcicella]MDR6563973.1 hypothetical protein [Arcicella sp. BE51]MDR6813726.1 hypothetical protein [Arcicella sp. BE140]MDR6825038.1 hypothetical protein [Arcicella sp. BE139]
MKNHIATIFFLFSSLLTLSGVAVAQKQSEGGLYNNTVYAFQSKIADKSYQLNISLLRDFDKNTVAKYPTTLYGLYDHYDKDLMQRFYVSAKTYFNFPIKT